MPEQSRGILIAAQSDELTVCQGWGFANEEDQVPFGCDTVVDVMSMTKQFTAAAVLKLQMRGELSVDDPISDYFDHVPVDKRAITVEHLLTHTSGLAGGLGDDYEPVMRDELIDRAMDSTLQSAPGTVYAYSNLGYSLLAAIVEMASASGYEAFLVEHLFTPAGMTSTGYVLPDWNQADIAIEYDADDAAQGRPTGRPWAEDGPYWNLRGNGGLLSTARDMFRWHVALLEDDVLNQDAKSQLFEPHVREEPEDTHYGYGWVITELDGQTAAWHNGANANAYGEIARTPDGRAMVFWISTQAISDQGQWDFEELGPELTEGTFTRLL
ncbi:serine hydrolase domain-containing protein [Actinoalloteichus hymeniacidonis]|uniref:serine hydrolase domain-containing protein n=1 Tax=Actinoalloteichus hymeniacidonis TaxID=340345 RepID=UPI0017CA7412|nr:serine hydrolase domain-containing protein [Actinoalloteichus hymeniacidonis]MBB5910486.1 CubicO group peptidase (beta-lactamase class C family) [Actinoalloteichus hymeniacidonis]